MPNSRRFLRFVLRGIGSASLLALVFVVAPRSSMDSIHRGLGLGALPEGPIVGYLARSTSAFYAILGGLFWLVSGDLTRFGPVLGYLGWSILALGGVLFGVDLHEGLPLWWTVWEGPFVAVFGATLLVLRSRLPGEENGPPVRSGSG